MKTVLALAGLGVALASSSLRTANTLAAQAHQMVLDSVPSDTSAEHRTSLIQPILQEWSCSLYAFSCLLNLHQVLNHFNDNLDR